MQGQEDHPSGRNRQPALPLHSKIGQHPNYYLMPPRQSDQPRHWSRWPATKKTGTPPLKASVTTAAYIDLPAPTVRNSRIPKPPVAGHATFTVTGEPEATIEEEVGALRLSRKLTCDPSPQVCNLDHVVTQQPFPAVDRIPDPSVDLVRIMPLLPHIQRFLSYFSYSPWSPGPVLHSSIREPPDFLDSSRLLANLCIGTPGSTDTLCLFDGKLRPPFIHESVNISCSFSDCSTKYLSLLVMKLHPSAPIVLGLSMAGSTNPTIDWSAHRSLSNRPLDQRCHRWPWPGRALQPPCPEDIISDSLSAFDSFLSFVLLPDFDPDQSGPDHEMMFLSSWGRSRQTLCPLLIYTWNRTRIRPT